MGHGTCDMSHMTEITYHDYINDLLTSTYYCVRNTHLEEAVQKSLFTVEYTNVLLTVEYKNILLNVEYKTVLSLLSTKLSSLLLSTKQTN